MQNPIQPLLDQLRLAGLPVKSSTLSALEEGLARSSFSYQQAAKIIIEDPNCTADFLAYTNDLLKDRPDAEVSTPLHAAMMLGMDGLEDFPKYLNTFTVIKDERIKPRIFQLESRALHAAHQAQEWAAKLGNSAEKNIFIAALLGSIVEIVLWQIAPQKIQEVELLIHRDKQQPKVAQQLILGFTYDQLAISLASHWKLPKLYDEVYEEYEEGEVPQRVRITRAANTMVELAERGWYTPAMVDFFDHLSEDFKITASHLATGSKRLLANLTRQYPQQFDRYGGSHYLALIDGEVSYTPLIDDNKNTSSKTSAPASKSEAEQPDTKEQAVTATSSATLDPVDNTSTIETTSTDVTTSSDPGDIAVTQSSVDTSSGVVEYSEQAEQEKRTIGGVEYACVESEDKKRAAPKEAVEAPAVSATESTITPAEEKIGQAPEIPDSAKKIEKALSRVHNSGDFVTLIRNTTSQLHSTIGIPRVAFILLSKDRKFVSMRTVVGNTDPVFAKLRLPLSPPHLFTKLLQKPQSVHINKTNRDKYAPLISSAMRQQISSQFFMARTIFFNKKPVGIVYADAGGKEECSDESYAAFKTICGEFEKQMLINAQNKANEKSE